MSKPRVGRRKKILLVDDTFLLETRNLRRRVNQAVKHPEPVMRADAPWNHDREDVNYVNVLYDASERVFRMWYAVIERIERGSAARRWAYATSRDGINWDRPELNRVEVNGSTRNNYMLDAMNDFCWTIVFDPSDPVARRYKMIFMIDAPEMVWGRFHVPLNLAYSADGLTWERPAHVNPVLRGVADGGMTLYYVPERRKYVLFTRRVPNLPRDVSMYESFDLVNWEDRGRALVAPDEHDPPSMFNLQSLTPFRYEGLHLGLVNTHYTLPGAEGYEVRHEPPADFGDPRMGILDIQMAYSRDGRTWHRPTDRRAILPTGDPGAPDAGELFAPQSSPPVVDGETWIFYTACPERHSIWDHRRLKETGRPIHRTVMMARMPEDHWVSLDAEAEEGCVVTRPIVGASSHRILLNADAEGGRIQGELVAPDGQVIDGFSRNDCVAMTGNGPEQALTWTGRATERNRDACVRIFLVNAKLYSLTMTSHE